VLQIFECYFLSRFELLFDSTTGKRYITAVPRA